MTTTSYTWGHIAASLANNTITAGQQTAPAVAADASGTRYFAAWDDPGGSVQGRIMDRDSNPLADQFSINSTDAGIQRDVGVAGLAGGRFVAAFTDYSVDAGGDIRARLFGADGTPVAADFAIDATSTDDSDGAIAALADGGFVVSYTTDFGGGDHDIVARVFNADGTARTGFVDVNSNTRNTSHSAVTGLAGGGFVVAWEESPAAGGNLETRFRLFDAAGHPLDGTANAGILIDAFGSLNDQIEVAALHDGGFVVAYRDNGWNIDQAEITVRLFNADGSARSDSILANAAALGGVTTGMQEQPTVAVLSNGDFVVGWVDHSGGFEHAQVFDPSGDPVGANSVMEIKVKQARFAALRDGGLAVVDESFVTDGSAGSIQSSVGVLARRITGDGTSETIAGVNDGLWEIISANGGNDVMVGAAGTKNFDGGAGFDTVTYESAAGGVTASMADPNQNSGDAAHHVYQAVESLKGSAFDDALTGDAGANNLRGLGGNDTLTGGRGHDTLDGGAGDDTAVFSQNFNDYAVQDFGARLTIEGPDGTDTAIAIEHLKFADVTITPADLADGNPLFDTLYYLSRNADVFHAGINALDHFNAFGWQEGRDPNGLFDVSAYLAVNKDVAASGANPLAQYHEQGWREGRDPGPGFDTTLYLIHNPDVAAAGVDPLAHYLAFGRAENRAPYEAVGPVVHGFDAQYYLFRNPDVAAAGVDPLAHFNQSGWHEGRNPNAWFDTAGYLAHYADVAASGANPLAHYEQFGWTEGRDPRASFDTLGYLAANPDVAAAHTNPLDHFLSFGIYEGRQPAGDGVWH